MDGAWALYEAWVRLQHGDIDSALVYAFGKSSPGDDPRGAGAASSTRTTRAAVARRISLAALQARALLEAGRITEEDMAEVAVRSRRDALDNPHAQLAATALSTSCWPRSRSSTRCTERLPADHRRRRGRDPGRRRPRPRDCERPAWIRGIDHRIDPNALGLPRPRRRRRHRARPPRRPGVGAGDIDIAELHAPFTHQELILREALGLGDDVDDQPVGRGAGRQPVMAAGLIRIGEAAPRIIDGDGRPGGRARDRGPCLQQNLVCVLEGE